ncbi:MAG: hypothetical protein ACR2JK_00150 [Geodermatophilaceae bacterium]
MATCGTGGDSDFARTAGRWFFQSYDGFGQCVCYPHPGSPSAWPCLQAPAARHWGYELRRATGVLYPLLSCWHEAGWLSDGWDDPAKNPVDSPRRLR